MQTIHYRTTDTEGYTHSLCGCKAAMTTAMVANVECKRCRKKLGLDPYDPLAALQNLATVNTERKIAP